MEYLLFITVIKSKIFIFDNIITSKYSIFSLFIQVVNYFCGFHEILAS